jgi:hypothetical protein
LPIRLRYDKEQKKSEKDSADERLVLEDYRERRSTGFLEPQGIENIVDENNLSGCFAINVGLSPIILV